MVTKKTRAMLETARTRIHCISDFNARSPYAQIEADQYDWRLQSRSINHGRPSHHSLHTRSVRADTHCTCSPRGLSRLHTLWEETRSLSNISDHSRGLHGNHPTVRTGYVRRVVICGLHVRHGVSHKLLPRAAEPQSALNAQDRAGEVTLGRQRFILASNGNQALSTRPAMDHETGFSSETAGCVGVHRLPLAVHPRWGPLLPQRSGTRRLATFEDVHDAPSHQRHSHMP